jgi:hypothetical protein
MSHTPGPNALGAHCVWLWASTHSLAYSVVAERSPGALFPDSAIQSVPHGLSITKRQLPSS